MPGDYVPIACAAHERRSRAEKRDGAEWLTIERPGGESEVVRLDRIHSAVEN